MFGCDSVLLGRNRRQIRLCSSINSERVVNYNDIRGACVWRAIMIVVKMSGAFNRGRSYVNVHYELCSIANWFNRECIRYIRLDSYSEIIYVNPNRVCIFFSDPIQCSSMCDEMFRIEEFSWKSTIIWKRNLKISACKRIASIALQSGCALQVNNSSQIDN